MRRVLLFFLLLAPLATSLKSSREAEGQDRNRRSNPNVGLQGNGGQGDARAKRSNQKVARDDEEEDMLGEFDFLESLVNQLVNQNDALRVKLEELKKDGKTHRSRVDELKKEDEALLSTVSDLKMQIGQRSQVAPLSPMLNRKVVRLAETINASHILNPKTMQLTAIEDCEDVRARDLPAGTYFLRPYAQSVFCTAAGEVLVLRRKEGDVDFKSSWTEYRSDLGELKAGDVFLGHDFLANFTSGKDVCMRRLTAGQLVVKKKKDIPGARKTVFSTIAPKNCSIDVKLFTVPETSLYTVTVGGAAGGLSKMKYPRPGGRGARVRAVFFWRKGEVIGASAGCWGDSYGKEIAGSGGDASWLVHRGKKILLAVAGGGGGGGGKSDDDKPNVLILPGMHGRSSPDGGEPWWDPKFKIFESDTMLRKVDPKYRAGGWEQLRDRLLSHKNGNLRSGGETVVGGGGGGGGGFEGGIRDLRSGTFYSSGGGGGSFCNATEGRECHVEAGGNGRLNGFVVIEKVSCS